MNSLARSFIMTGLTRRIACCESKENELLTAEAQASADASAGQYSTPMWIARFRRLKKSKLKRFNFNVLAGAGETPSEAWDAISVHSFFSELARTRHKYIGIGARDAAGYLYYCIITAD